MKTLTTKKISSLSVSNKCFSMLHVNIRSIPKHFAELENYLINAHHEFTIIALTETWFNDITIDRYDLQGYCHEFEYRKQRRGGGVFIHSKWG